MAHSKKQEKKNERSRGAIMEENAKQRQLAFINLCCCSLF